MRRLPEILHRIQSLLAAKQETTPELQNKADQNPSNALANSVLQLMRHKRGELRNSNHLSPTDANKKPKI